MGMILGYEILSADLDGIEAEARPLQAQLRALRCRRLPDGRLRDEASVAILLVKTMSCSNAIAGIL